MSQERLIYQGIGLFVLIMVGLIGWWSRRRPNREKNRPEAIRQPRVIGIVGWLIAPIGLLLILSSGSIGPEDQLPMLLCGVVLFMTAALLVTIYINWYVIIRDDEIIQRTVWRQFRIIRYAEIDRVQRYRQGKVPMLKLWGNDGTTIQLNSAAFDTSPIFLALERRRVIGE